MAAEQHDRAHGEDIVVSVRLRRANLPALEQGIVLGRDLLTHGAIELHLVPRSDGIHDLMVVTNSAAMANAPEPVDPEMV